MNKKVPVVRFELLEYYVDVVMDGRRKSQTISFMGLPITFYKKGSNIAVVGLDQWLVDAHARIAKSVHGER